MGSVEVPSRHKALVYDSPGKISTKIEEIDTPKPGVGEVLVNLTHTGVCHSDMGVMWYVFSHILSMILLSGPRSRVMTDSDVATLGPGCPPPQPKDKSEAMRASASLRH